MDYRKLGLGLGIASIAIGTDELLATRRLTMAPDAEGRQGLVRAFGGRELLSGANLLLAPAHATNVWNRVAGDLMDVAATAAAVRNRPQNRTTWGALAFVAGALSLDPWVARGLDHETGKALPLRDDAALAA